MSEKKENETKVESNTCEEKIETEEKESKTKQEPESNNQKDESKQDLAAEYLNLARIIQADFDNYRKKSLEQIEKARIDGISSAVEILLPSIDAFAKVKENISDEKTLEGINMLEKQILSSLNKLGVEKIEAVGIELNPNVHNVLAISKDETKQDGVILAEFQAGFKLKDKIIRCSQVLVNKLN